MNVQDLLAQFVKELLQASLIDGVLRVVQNAIAVAAISRRRVRRRKAREAWRAKNSRSAIAQLTHRRGETL